MKRLEALAARSAIALACCAAVIVPRAAAAQAAPDSLAFRALTWREIGPMRAGRSLSAAGSAARPLEYYHGTTGGGVFKTVNGGMTWFPVTDRYFGGTVGAVAVSPSNPDVVYAASGEGDIRGNVSHGDGMFRSTDGGATWSFIGLGDVRQFSRVRVDPRNPDVVYVAAFGHVWAPHAERGVYKTTDGGKTWRKILFRNDSTGARDVVLDPSNPDVVYAALWQAYRTPWTMVSGGAGSGVFKSTDGGEHWTELTRAPGMPNGVIGNIGLAVSPAKPGRVWALVEAKDGGLFRSDDGGATWQRTSADLELRRRPWYYMHVTADPVDSNTVYVLNLAAHRSRDGGRTFTPLPAPHGDHHDLWIAPNDPRRMVLANDGGAQVSTDGGQTWTMVDQPTGQFYHVETTNDFPYRVCGAQQDNTTLCGPSRAQGGIDVTSWYPVGGGESGWVAARPDTPSVVFAGSYGGIVDRTDLRSGLERSVDPWPDWPMEHAAIDDRYRFQYTSPLVFSPHAPYALYSGANVLFRTTSDGQSWSVISPDLTRHDPATLQSAGGPITPDNTGPEIYGTIFTVAESPVRRGVIWAGSDDGLVHVTRDDGKTWQDVTPAGIPKWLRMSAVEPSHFDAGTAYVAANHYQRDDLRPYLFRTTDYGKSWTRIVDGLPETEFTRVIREDPVRRGLLYAGTERGVWVSFDDGAHWRSLKQNLPPVPVHDLKVKDGDLVVATHGRGFWILDDVTPLRELAPERLAGAAPLLFTPRTATLARFANIPQGRASLGLASSRNPPDGVGIHYYLAAPAKSLTLDFLDSAGTVIRSFSTAAVAPAGPAPSPGRRGVAPSTSLPNDAGLNAFYWDLRLPEPTSFRGMTVWSRPPGPSVVPGRYTARLTADGRPMSRTFVVTKDPRSSATARDLVAQFALGKTLTDTLSAVNDAVRTIRNVRAQLAQRAARLPAEQAATLRTRAAAIADTAARVERVLYQVLNNRSHPIMLNDRLGGVATDVIRTDGRPTEQMYAASRELMREAGLQLATLRRALGGLGPVNEFLASVGQAAIVPSTAEAEPSPRSAADGTERP